jgi:hypothetical protein
MLRKWVLAIGLFLLGIGGVVLIEGGCPPAFVFVFWGAIIAGGILFERFRYKPLEVQRPGPGWERTTERFVDDETGSPVTVYIQPQTGERMYVKE